MCTFDSSTLNMCQVQVATLYVWPPTSAPLQGICAKWTSCLEINKVSPQLQLYLTNKSCRQCWCSPPLYCWCQPSVCDCRQQCDRWKELCRTNRRKSLHFHILRQKCQNHVMRHLFLLTLWPRQPKHNWLLIDEVEKDWASGSSCVHTSITMLYGSLFSGRWDHCDAG